MIISICLLFLVCLPDAIKPGLFLTFFFHQLDMNLNTGLSTGGILNSTCLNQNLQNFMVRCLSFGKSFPPCYDYHSLLLLNLK